MMTAEKMIDMMNPAKAFEALSQGAMFDVAGSSKLLESAADQLVGLMDLYEAQTHKAVDFWMSQNELALKEGKKLLKEWVATVSKANSEFVSEVESSVKDAAKVFELPKPEKASKKA